jgi:hypothetical protein
MIVAVFCRESNMLRFPGLQSSDWYIGIVADRPVLNASYYLCVFSVVFTRARIQPDWNKWCVNNSIELIYSHFGDIRRVKPVAFPVIVGAGADICLCFDCRIVLSISVICINWKGELLRGNNISTLEMDSVVVRVESCTRMQVFRYLCFVYT